jgi:hypothetical protein
MKVSFSPLNLFSPSYSTPELVATIDLFLQTWSNEHSLEEGFELFHYSTLNGIQSILEERSLWFGHATSFNDPLEIKYGQEILREELTKMMESENDFELRSFLNGILINISAFDLFIHHPFVACFCESGELLSQWRAYADQGGGYALGFRFSSKTLISPSPGDLSYTAPPVLRKVIYDENRQRNLVCEYLKSIIETSREALKEKRHEAQASIMAMQAVNLLLDMMLTFKHRAFDEEKEWRLIRATRRDFQPENLQFRRSNNNLVPYRATYLFDKLEKQSDGIQYVFPLSSIVFGPSLDAIRTKVSLELLHQKSMTYDHPIMVNKLLPIKGCGYTLR